MIQNIIEYLAETVFSSVGGIVVFGIIMFLLFGGRMGKSGGKGSSSSASSAPTSAPSTGSTPE